MITIVSVEIFMLLSTQMNNISFKIVNVSFLIVYYPLFLLILINELIQKFGVMNDILWYYSKTYVLKHVGMISNARYCFSKSFYITFNSDNFKNLNPWIYLFIDKTVTVINHSYIYHV